VGRTQSLNLMSVASVGVLLQFLSIVAIAREKKRHKRRNLDTFRLTISYQKLASKPKKAAPNPDDRRNHSTLAKKLRA